MNYSRRDLSLLLPALAAANLSAQKKGVLPSGTFSFPELTAKTNGKNATRPVFDGETHTGFPIELHETELGPGLAPHPPHHHVHEEMIMIREGTLEVTITGHTTQIGPGSVAYVASGEEHGWRNVGSSQAHYFVLALGREKA